MYIYRYLNDKYVFPTWSTSRKNKSKQLNRSEIIGRQYNRAVRGVIIFFYLGTAKVRGFCLELKVGILLLF